MATPVTNNAASEQSHMAASTKDFQKLKKMAFPYEWSDIRHRNFAPAICEQHRQIVPLPFRRRCLQETTLLENGELLDENLEAMTGGL